MTSFKGRFLGLYHNWLYRKKLNFNVTIVVNILICLVGHDSYYIASFFACQKCDILKFPGIELNHPCAQGE